MIEAPLVHRKTLNDWQGLIALQAMGLYCLASACWPGSVERLFFSPWPVLSAAMGLAFEWAFFRNFIDAKGRPRMQIWLGAGGAAFSLYLAVGLVVKEYDVYSAWIFWVFLSATATSLKKPVHSLSLAFSSMGFMTAAHLLADQEKMPYAWWFYCLVGTGLILSVYSVLLSNVAYRKALIRRRSQLAAKQRELEAILNSVHPLIVYKDTENRIVDLNAAFAQRMGKPREEIIGTSLYDVMPYDEAMLYHKEDLEIIRSGQPKLGIVECVSIVGSGNESWMRSNKTPIFDETGTGIGLVIYSEDITGEMEARQKLRESEERLRAYSSKLEESNQSLQEFAYVISHDLREPLRSITAYTQLLQRTLKPEHLTQDARDFMAFVVGAAKRMDRQINGILEYSRVGRAVLNLEKMPLLLALETVQLNLRAQIAEVGASVEADGALPEIMADRMQITLLLQNLVSNGLKYRRPDVPPIVRVRAEHSEEGWKTSVSDNGMGIEPQYLEMIFGVFRRLQTHGDVEGSGIGLSICRRVAQRHGGRIWAESTPGEGTTFSFILPEHPQGG